MPAIASELSEHLLVFRVFVFLFIFSFILHPHVGCDQDWADRWGPLISWAPPPNGDIPLHHAPTCLQRIPVLWPTTSPMRTKSLHAGDDGRGGLGARGLGELTTHIRRVRYQAYKDDSSGVTCTLDGFIRDDSELNNKRFPCRIALKQQSADACSVQV